MIEAGRCTQIGYAGMKLLAFYVTIACSNGCEVVSMAASAVAGPKGQALYELKDQPTLTMVDDPRSMVGSASLRHQIAHHVGYCLQNHGVIEQVIDPQLLANLKVAVGDTYDTMPVADLGRELGAAQVIYVKIKSFALQTNPGMYQPTANVDVQVIDVIQSRRTFPHSGLGPANAYPLKIQYRPRTREIFDYGTPVILSRELAQRIGRDVARLFYDYELRQVGDPFDD